MVRDASRETPPSLAIKTDLAYAALRFLMPELIPLSCAPLLQKIPSPPLDIPFDWKVYASREMRCSDIYVAQYHCYGGKEIMIETWTFEVTGSQRMDCEGCEHAVQRSLT